MNGLALIAVGIACFTLLLITGMWKADKDQQRAMVRELAADEERRMNRDRITGMN